MMIHSEWQLHTLNLTFCMKHLSQKIKKDLLYKQIFINKSIFEDFLSAVDFAEIDVRKQ